MASADFVAFRKVLSRARNVFVITGAGISAESRIPTFRGAGGLWRKYAATDLATPEAFGNNPSLVWEFYHYRRELVASKSPNAGHYAIKDLEKLFTDAKRSFTLATQNVDGLHAVAGSKNVIELHGSLFKVRCTKCQKVTENRTSPICPALAGRGSSGISFKIGTSSALNASNELAIPVSELPRCTDCGGLLRPHVVWFGEQLDPVNLSSAEAAAAEADVCLVVGTSSVVYPAAGLALIAARRGVPVAEVNLEPTPVTTTVSFYFEGKAGTILPQLLGDLILV
uniref:NAD-dependent protein deacylase n=1 Tax=Mesocestoides corti TaxID=53468 RepID=A0A5K3FPQ3_MESCO